MWHALWEFLFPHVCVACEGKLQDDECEVCQDCLNHIARTDHFQLSPNGVDLLMARKIADEQKTIPYVQGAAWAFYNRERGQVLRTLIDKGKFGSFARPEIFYTLAVHAALDYVDTDLLNDIDYIVPIPLSKKRFRERGFNQAEWICRGLSEVWRIPMDTAHLVRAVDNKHQSRSTMKNRAANVKNIFQIRYPEEWKNRHVLIVDDVITSGSTLYEAIQCLCSIRGCKASIFTLGWAHG